MVVISKGSRTASAARVPRGTENADFLTFAREPIILATAVGDDNGDGIMNGAAVELQFRTGVDAFTKVLAGSGDVRMSSGTTLRQGDPVELTDRITTGVFGPYRDGVEVEPDGLSAQTNSISNRHTEFQWALDFSNAPNATIYDFQVLWATQAGIDAIPYISIASPLSPFPGELVHLWDTFNKQWGIGQACIPLANEEAVITMLSEETFSRIYNKVPKWDGATPIRFRRDEIRSRWLEITEPQPTDPVEA